MDKASQTSIKIFISYSHDSEAHKSSVRRLSERLILAGGIDCEIDQYHASPVKGWQTWMLHQIEDADFVLIICTDNYLRRFDKRETRNIGKGVTYEGSIINQEIYENRGKNSKFIPILMNRKDKDSIPLALKSSTAYHVNDENGFELLYRHITNQPLVIKPKTRDNLLILPPKNSYLEQRSIHTIFLEDLYKKIRNTELLESKDFLYFSYRYNPKYKNIKNNELISCIKIDKKTEISPTNIEIFEKDFLIYISSINDSKVFNPIIENNLSDWTKKYDFIWNKLFINLAWSYIEKSADTVDEEIQFIPDNCDRSFDLESLPFGSPNINSKTNYCLNISTNSTGYIMVIMSDDKEKILISPSHFLHDSDKIYKTDLIQTPKLMNTIFFKPFPKFQNGKLETVWVFIMNSPIVLSWVSQTNILIDSIVLDSERLSEIYKLLVDQQDIQILKKSFSVI